MPRKQPRSKKIPGPLYPLERVRRLAALAIVPGGPTHHVVDQTKMSDPEAEAYVRGTLKNLEAGAYVESREMTYARADVYAIEDGDWKWYLKFTEGNDGRLVVFSCHYPTDDLLRNDGKWVRV